MGDAVFHLAALDAAPELGQDVDSTAARGRGGAFEALRVAAGADQAAQERPRLGAFVRVVAYLAADSTRRLAAFVRASTAAIIADSTRRLHPPPPPAVVRVIAYVAADSTRRLAALVRWSPAFLGAAAAFEPWSTAAIETLGSAACLATAVAWAGLRAAPAQPRRWAFAIRVVGDASRRLVASALRSPAFHGAAPFLPPGTMRLVGALAAAGYLTTVAARAGFLAILAQPRRPWAQASLRSLFLAAAGYAVVTFVTERPVLLVVSTLVPAFLQLGGVLAAVVVAYAARYQE